MESLASWSDCAEIIRLKQQNCCITFHYRQGHPLLNKILSELTLLIFVHFLLAEQRLFLLHFNIYMIKLRRVIYSFTKGLIPKIEIQEETYEQFKQPTLAAPQILDVQDDKYKYVDIVHKEAKTQQDDGKLKLTIDGKVIEYSGIIRNDIDMTDNPLALQVMSEKSISIDDPRIKVQSIKGDIMQNMNQIDLGSVFVTPKNTINLQDIDVNNIPEDLDIQIDKESKQLYAIGTKSDEISRSEKLNIDNTIIEDISFQEFKDENLFKFEQQFVIMNKSFALKKFIRMLPIYFIIYCYLEVFWELYFAKQRIHDLELQEFKALDQKLSKYQSRLLLNNELFRKI